MEKGWKATNLRLKQDSYATLSEFSKNLGIGKSAVVCELLSIAEECDILYDFICERIEYRNRQIKPDKRHQEMIADFYNKLQQIKQEWKQAQHG
jgi:hypothetical protein